MDKCSDTPGDASPQQPGAPIQSTTGRRDNDLGWPVEYSLDRRPGYSSQLIGLSGESDPFLLRHFLFHVFDHYPMFKVDYRKMVDDANLQRFAAPIEPCCPNQGLPADEMPVQFAMLNEELGEEKGAARRTVSGYPESEEIQDRAIIEKMVCADLHHRLLKL